jgi:hypothetical protein
MTTTDLSINSMPNPIHSLTLVGNADSPEALIGTMIETLEEILNGFKRGELSCSGVIAGGGPRGHAQGFYTHPEDNDFSGALDGTEVPPVFLDEKVPYWESQFNELAQNLVPFDQEAQETKNKIDESTKILDEAMKKIANLFPGSSVSGIDLGKSSKEK